MARQSAAQKAAEQEAAAQAAAEQEAAAAAEAQAADAAGEPETGEGAQEQPEPEQEAPAGPQVAEQSPLAHGAHAIAKGELPTEPGTETREGVDGVANAESIVNKETGVPGAPLDTPTPLAVSTENIEQTLATPGVLGAAMVGEGSRLLDEATGQAPDPDELFDNPYGSTYVARVRLVEDVAVGNGSVTRRLVLPAGQVMSAATAEQFKARVRAQQG